MRSPRLAAAVTCASLLATTLACPRSSLAAPQAPSGGSAPTGNAAEHFQRGVDLYKEGDYRGALVEFQRAYDINPKHQVLFNIAESHYQLQDYASALKAFQKYLDEGGAQIAPKRRKDVESEIATLSKRVATITIMTSEPGAAVTIDDVAVGTSPIEGLLVSSGRRRIVATLSGRAPATSTIDLAGGDKKTIAIEIPPATASGPAPPPPPAETEEPSVVPMAVAWSITGALAAGAVVTGVLALGASSDLEDELARYPGNADDLASAKDSTFALGLTTDILLGAAVVGAGIATYFTVDYYFLSAEEPAEEEPAEEEAARVRRTPKTGVTRVGVSPGGVIVGGAF